MKICWIFWIFPINDFENEIINVRYVINVAY